MLRALGGTGTSGGDGSLGRIRYCTSIGDITALTGVPDNPPPNLAPFGQTFYTLNASTLTSAVYDSGNSSPTYNSYQVTQNVPAGSSLTLEFAGSSDGFVQDDTGWKSTAQLSQLDGKRYYRFRVSLQTADRTETPVLSALSFDVTDHIQSNFNFNIGSCAGATPTMPVGHPFALSILFLIWLALTMRLGRYSR